MVHFGSQVEHEPTVVPKSENPKLADLVASVQDADSLLIYMDFFGYSDTYWTS